MVEKDTRVICYYVQKIADVDLDNGHKVMFYDKSSAKEYRKQLKLVGISAKLVAIEVTITSTLSERLLEI